MARIHFDKALETDSQNELALEGKQRLEAQKTAGKPTTSTPQAAKTSAKATPQKPASKAHKPNDQSGGGLFGLFGGKKK